MEGEVMVEQELLDYIEDKKIEINKEKVKLLKIEEINNSLD